MNAARTLLAGLVLRLLYLASVLVPAGAGSELLVTHALPGLVLLAVGVVAAAIVPGQIAVLTSPNVSLGLAGGGEVTADAPLQKLVPPVPLSAQPPCTRTERVRLAPCHSQD